MAKRAAIKGRFITIDGIEGAGKSTQLGYLRQWCAAENIETIFTREPGGTVFGEDLREVLLNFSSNIHPMTELLVLLAARREHIETVILPALRQGKWVISDRFSDSTYAYQHFGRGLPFDTLQQLEKLSGTDLQPDLRLILGVSLATSAKRLQQRGQILDRFERENDDFFARVLEGYRHQATTGGVWIDCKAEPERVFAKICSHLEKLK